MSNHKDLLTQSIQAAHEARDLLNQITDKTDEGRARELDEQANRAFAQSEALQKRAEMLRSIEERDATLNAADPRREVEDRSAAATGAKTKEERHAAVFEAAMRGHELPESGREFRDQNVGTNSAGGYLVPAQFQANLIKAQKAFGPMNDDSVISYLNTGTGAKLTWPKMDDTANKGRMIGEATALQSNASVTFSTIDLDAYKGTSDIILVSDELLNDAEISIESILTDAIAERLGRLVNYQLTVGTGTSAPNGLITAVGTPSLLTTANAVIATDDILNLSHEVDPAYRGNPGVGFMFNDATLLDLKKKKDNNGNYIWQPGTVQGAAPTIFGYKYAINQDMASIATGNVPVVFGDFKKYQARRVNNVVIKRLNERFADSGQVAFLAFIRFDGDLMDSRAIKGLKVK
ncbi:phage major capsid protein [Caulobacter sp. UC70_42]|uniref:phage major capsid protein n=1 Tax=Caulobacter sp. UC70_42 TaxID=3374551 RepID=UPI0037570B6F